MTVAPMAAEAPDGVSAAGVLRVAVVNGSPSRNSKTAALTDVIVSLLAEVVPVQASRIDVYDLGPGFSGARRRDEVGATAEEALRRVEEADVIVAATPVFRGSYTGMFKHFFDLIDQYALANTIVLLAATGGGEHHALVLDHALRPLFAFFQALTAPVSVFASSGDFDGTTLLTPRVYSRIQMALEDIRPLLEARA
jgi:FMN reductase